jgi:hypothetical protein
MEEFTGSMVVMPEGISRINYLDKEIVDHREKDAVLVVYVDSVACATCNTNGMFQYDEVIAFGADPISDYAPAFIFAPPKKVNTMTLRELCRMQANYMALKERMFPVANPHIPADKRFHTFLLDKNGKVVFVGDPVNNPPLRELYKTTITTLIENDGVMPSEETQK